VRESAEPSRSAQVGVDLTGAVERLPWLCPGAAALTALGRLPSPDTWSTLRHDPAAVLLVLRQPGESLGARLEAPELFTCALDLLDDANSHFVDWNGPALRRIVETGQVCAAFAESLARKVGRCSPDDDWLAGLLAPLGWYTACALNAEAAAACLADPALKTQPAETQRRHWNVDASGLARRLARRWDLPDWIAAVAGHLALPVEMATGLGADPLLFRITRLAVGLARECGFDIGLPIADRAADMTAIGLAREEVDRLEMPALPKIDWQNPRQVPLLRDLLLVARENRRMHEGTLRRHIEREADQLHDALEQRLMAGQGDCDDDNEDAVLRIYYGRDGRRGGVRSG